MRFTVRLVLGVVAVGVMASSANAIGTDITFYVNAYSESGNPLGSLDPGDKIIYEIAVAADPTAGHAQGNLGLATIVYHVESPQAMAKSYWLTDTGDNTGQSLLGPAKSGWSEKTDGSGVPDVLKDVTKGMYYVDDATTVYAGYNGGWGFDNAGFPTGGNATSSPGKLISAGLMAPLGWTADANTLYPGLQPYARQGVGHGIYTFPLADPGVGDLQGGFGQDLSNLGSIVEGDGHWLIQRGTIDTALGGGARGDWDMGTYVFNIVPSSGAVYSPTFDYNSDVGAGFRILVPADDQTGTDFSFTLIPEPTTLGVVLLGAVGMAISRRRR